MNTPLEPLTKSPYLITKLAIVAEDGEPIQKPFPLQEGENKFRCLATYVDGSSSFYDSYWTCPIIYKRGGHDLWGVLGRQRMREVTIRASARHERYTELACWVFEPRDDRPNEIPRDSTGFDYSQIK
jgi:hypothetical protein